MWPFTKKHNFIGFQKGKEGDLNFSLTEEEKAEVKKQFDMFKGHKVNPEFADQIHAQLTARGLSGYAHEQIALTRLSTPDNDKEQLLEKAISAISKAYSFYSLPIFLYDLACFIEIKGDNNFAKEAFKEFLKAQSNYKNSKLDEALLQERDINEAIKEAESKS